MSSINDSEGKASAETTTTATTEETSQPHTMFNAVSLTSRDFKLMLPQLKLTTVDEESDSSSSPATATAAAAAATPPTLKTNDPADTETLQLQQLQQMHSPHSLSLSNELSVNTSTSPFSSNLSSYGSFSAFNSGSSFLMAEGGTDASSASPLSSTASSRETSPRGSDISKDPQDLKQKLKEMEREKKKQRFLERSLEKRKDEQLPTVQSMPSLSSSSENKATLGTPGPSPRVDPEHQLYLRILHPDETECAAIFDYFLPEGSHHLLPKVEIRTGKFTDEGVYDVDCMIMPLSLTPKGFYTPFVKSIASVLGDGLIDRLKKVYSRGFGALPPNYTVLVPVVQGGSFIAQTNSDENVSKLRRGTTGSTPTLLALRNCTLSYVLCVATWKQDNSNRNPSFLKDAFRAALMEIDLHNNRMLSGSSNIDGGSYASRHKFINRVLTPAFTHPDIEDVTVCGEAMGKTYWQYVKYRGYPNIPQTYVEGSFRKAFKAGCNQERGLKNVKELHKLISIAANTTKEYKEDVQSNALKHLNYLLQRKQSVQLFWTRDNVLQQIRQQHLNLHSHVTTQEKEKEKEKAPLPIQRKPSISEKSPVASSPSLHFPHSWLEALVERAVEAPPDKVRFQPWIPFDSVEEGSMIGRGTYGKVKKAVLKARNENGDIEKINVALKTIEFATFRDPKIVSKIHKEVIREATIMSVCRHPRVLPCFGAKFTDARVDILTEIADGDLFKYLARHPPSAQRLRIAQQIAEGMMYMHSFDYMHRDLKSLNILVFNRGESSVDIKISDFGSARIVDFTMSVDVGTPRWTAPEVIAGKDYTKKADVFSFAIVMWEILAMVPPYNDFKGTSFVLTTKITEGLRPTVPATLQHDPYILTMKKCWDTNPIARPSFSEVLAALLQVHDIPPFEASAPATTTTKPKK
eukprot:TRINITY_DN4173_c0_g1_i2.p1 TRINITY_DN4173_c0_g1~~TRINITY_DN4173_c0_g1_i2.p1  ORF type:complete len:941 (-),score=236.98 TRINITY_DN4173_c0_g1_i2:113-2863(-)